jgi:hypothetical protein
MAFAYTVEEEGVIGDLKYKVGTFTSSAGGTGGDIITGLQRVIFASLVHTGSAVVASAPVINETFPSIGTLTIVTVADTAGIWYAIGK